jgi:mannosyltransferase OCH1-like enzyme
VHTLTLAKRSDWVRLELLNRYGGIWLDASTILTESLAWVLARPA